MLRELEPLGPDTDRQPVAGVDMARAWIALVDGRLTEARERATAAAAHALGAEQHAALVLATRAALWQDDRAGVAGGLAALTATGQHGRAVAAAERRPFGRAPRPSMAATVPQRCTRKRSVRGVTCACRSTLPCA